MPGSRHTVPEGAKCDSHPDRPAVERIQGETDSMGAELCDMCAECCAEYKKHAADGQCGGCDWCNKEATDLRPFRDTDEGSSGPVYQVCGACRTKAHEAAAQELEEMRQDPSYYFLEDW
jgi:hypothetical protein